MIGVGVGVGFGGVGLGPAWLQSQLMTLHGANLTGLWLFGDATVAAGVIEALPARVGSAAANIGGAAKCAVTTVNGRQFSSLTSAAAVGYGTTLSSAVKSALVVANIPTAPGAAAWYALSGAGGVENIMAADSAGSWHTNTGFAHTSDGAASETISTGVHIYEAVDAACTQTDFRMCGIGSAFGTQFGFIGGLGLVRTLAAAASAPTLTSELAILQRYFRL